VKANVDDIRMLEELNNTFKIKQLDFTQLDTEISPVDDMYVAGRRNHYFSVGMSGLQNIIRALDCAGKSSDDIKTILDFPSGGGRVLRFLKAYFPSAEITAADNNEEKLDFCENRFNVNKMTSKECFSQIQTSRSFDLIWCGSLVTHISKKRTKELVRFFCEHLNRNGILIFTTHGRFCKDRFDQYGARPISKIGMAIQYKLLGYVYSRYPGDRSYGISVSRPSEVIKAIESYEELKIIYLNEMSWDNHQDVIGCLKK
jgi:SAM-dependent methyltransferase